MQGGEMPAAESAPRSRARPVAARVAAAPHRWVLFVCVLL